MRFVTEFEVGNNNVADKYVKISQSEYESLVENMNKICSALRRLRLTIWDSIIPVVHENIIPELTACTDDIDVFLSLFAEDGAEV